MAGLVMSALFFACAFAAHSSAEQAPCAKGLTRNAKLGLAYANFVSDLFHHLDVSRVGGYLAHELGDCVLACLRLVSCFSFNVAAYPDKNDRIMCELLVSDKYNSSEKFQPNASFHHYSIYNPCSERPCINGGTCIALYYHYDFKCKCSPEFKGKICETDVDECTENKHNCSANAVCQNTQGSFNCKCNCGFQADGVNCNEGFGLCDSQILNGHPGYTAKLREYLEPVQGYDKPWNLCFRASDHQYSAAAFHAACDNKGGTITLVRVGISVFGGYTDKSWHVSDGFTASTAAFLFSLKNHLNQQFKMVISETSYAMYGSQSKGPTFGHWYDLYLADNCNDNSDSHSNLGHTYSAPNGYESAEAQRLLAGSHTFSCGDYEVFYHA